MNAHLKRTKLIRENVQDAPQRTLHKLCMAILFVFGLYIYGQAIVTFVLATLGRMDLSDAEKMVSATTGDRPITVWSFTLLGMIYFFAKHRFDRGAMLEREEAGSDHREIKEALIARQLKAQIERVLYKKGAFIIPFSSDLQAIFLQDQEFMAVHEIEPVPFKVEFEIRGLRLGSATDGNTSLENTARHISPLTLSAEKSLCQGRVDLAWYGTFELESCTIHWRTRTSPFNPYYDNRRFIFAVIGSRLERNWINFCAFIRWRLVSHSALKVFIYDYSAFVAITLCIFSLFGLDYPALVDWIMSVCNLLSTFSHQTLHDCQSAWQYLLEAFTSRAKK